MAHITPGFEDMLGRLFQDTDFSEAHIKGLIRKRVLDLPQKVTYGNCPETERLSRSADPFDRAGAQNPDVIPFIKRCYGSDASQFAAALAQSERLFGEKDVPDQAEVLMQPATGQRILQAVATCRFNVPALHAFTQFLHFANESLASTRVVVERLALDPSNGQARFMAANNTMDLGWWEESARLLERNIASITLGLGERIWVVLVIPMWADAQCRWLDEHFKADRPGLVGGIWDDERRRMLVDPFGHMAGPMALFESHYEGMAETPQEQEEDRQKLAHLKSEIARLKKIAVETGRLEEE